MSVLNMALDYIIQGPSHVFDSVGANADRIWYLWIPNVYIINHEYQGFAVIPRVLYQMIPPHLAISQPI